MTERNPPISSSIKSKLPSRGAGNLLDILRSSVPDLNNGEAKVARVILASAEWVAQSSIKAVAGKAAVSEPTVLRMCRRIGLEGFKALKHRLAQDLILSQVLNGPHLEDSDASPSELVKVMLDASMGALRGAAQKTDVKVLDEAAAAVVEARQTYCIGVGGSSSVLCEELENRMFRLGLPVQSIQDSYRQRMAAAVAGKGDLFVAISSTGVPAPVVQSIELARSNGATTLAITQVDSPLAKVSEIVLPVELFNDHTFFMLPAQTRYAQLFTIDCLMGTIAARMPNAASNLQSIRNTLRALHGTIRHQPIGD
jgi:RpiR family carbohydrate utilization transcriptional regulator